VKLRMRIASAVVLTLVAGLSHIAPGDPDGGGFCTCSGPEAHMGVPIGVCTLVNQLGENDQGFLWRQDTACPDCRIGNHPCPLMTRCCPKGKQGYFVCADMIDQYCDVIPVCQSMCCYGMPTPQVVLVTCGGTLVSATIWNCSIPV